VRWGLLDVVPVEQARAIVAAARRRTFARAEVVFHEGDPGDTLHLVAAGRVAIRVTTPLGETATVRIVGPGDWFGELAVVSPAPRNASVVALEPVETLSIHRDQFTELRRSNPGVDAILVEALVSEVRRLSSQLLTALYVPVPQRVVHCLLQLRDSYAAAPGPVTVPLTQEDLAGLCGATRPTTNQILKRLEADGLIALGRGRVTVLDAEGLRGRAP
jgi:CRP/FNR family cyclic AMP-dependent transcriptional regulator